MAGNGKKRGLSPEEWADVRNAHSKGESDLSIAKRLGIHRNSIRNRREADAKRGDPWTVQPTVQLHNRASAKALTAGAQAKVIDIATRRAIDQAAQDGTLDAVQDAIVSELKATSEAGKLAAQYMLDILEQARGGKILPAQSPGQQTIADVAKSVMSAFRTFQTTVRENHGLDKTTPSIPKNDDAEKVTEVRFTIVGPEKTGTEG